MARSQQSQLGNPKKLDGDWRSIQGNFGPPGSLNDLSKIKTYSDYHELLADPDIDLVDVCLPLEQHEQVTLEAIKAGKNVMVEKPISLDLKAANRMVLAAQKANVQLMVASRAAVLSGIRIRSVGSCEWQVWKVEGRSSPPCNYAAQLVEQPV